MVTSFFSSIRWIRINLSYKELGQEFNQTDYVMVNIKNVSNRPSDSTFNISVPEKIPWVVLNTTRLDPNLYSVPRILIEDKDFQLVIKQGSK